MRGEQLQHGRFVFAIEFDGRGLGRRLVGGWIVDGEKAGSRLGGVGALKRPTLPAPMWLSCNSHFHRLFPSGIVHGRRR
jgi:hypothetical protein